MARSRPAILILDQEGIGPRVAEARKLRGLTQQGLALLVPCSASLVNRVESGRRAATPAFVAAVARALRVDVTELTGQPYRGNTEQTDRVHASIPQIRIAMSYWDVPPELEIPARPLDAIRDDVRAIAELLNTVDYVELGKRIPGVLEELSTVLHASEGAARQESAELLMHTYIAAKSVAYRLGYVDLVSVAIDRATWAAHESRKPELLALAAEERCQVFFATGGWQAGLRFIDRAHEEFGAIMSESEPGLAVAGSLHLRSAIMAARGGKGADAWDFISHAREVAGRIGRDTNHYGLIFGPTNVKIHEVATAIELDDADAAIRRAEGFEPPSSLPVERSSHHYMDLARAQLYAGQREHAQVSLARAEDLAPQHTRNHPMARETVTGLLRAHSRIPDPLRAMARRMSAGSPRS